MFSQCLVWAAIKCICFKLWLVQCLQRLQNRAARIILKRDSSRDTFNVLGWTDLETNSKIHKCVLVFKCLHNLVPQYLSNYFIRNYNVHGYNTRRKADLHLPKPKLSLGKRTFRFSGTALFNSLPCKIQQAVSLSKPILFIAPNLWYLFFSLPVHACNSFQFFKLFLYNYFNY